ncbi:MAG TPA: hypothetical protein VF535_02180 [Allosphingosinicella sp.]
MIAEEPAGAWGAAIRIDQRYRPLVERLSRTTQDDPAAYRRRVVLAAVLGYDLARGDDEAAAGARARLGEAIAAADSAAAEFRTLRPDSEIEAPELSDEERAEFRRSVDGIPGLRAVHVGWRHLADGAARQQLLLVTFRGGGVDADPQDVLTIVGEKLLPWATISASRSPPTRVG